MRRFLLLLVGIATVRAAHPPAWLVLPAPGERRPADASAWVLVDSTRVSRDGDGQTLFHYRHAVMPLSDAGLDQATCNLVMDGGDKLARASAWAMAPDGKDCHEFGGDEFVVYNPTVSNWAWDQLKAILFRPQAYVRAGWIFAWEIEIRSPSTAFDVHWSPRENLPVREASLEVAPAPGGAVKWRAFASDLPAPIAGHAPGSLTWTIRNLPPYPPDYPAAVRPDSTELRAYFLEPGATADASKSWGDVVRLARAEMDPRAQVTPAIKAEVALLAPPKSTAAGLWARIEPVCRFVQKSVAYLSITIDTDSMAGYRPHPAGDVLANRFGDCKDKATLLRTMLQELGVDARVMLVNSGVPMANRPDWPSAYFNHAIVAIRCPDGDPPPSGWTVVQSAGKEYALFDPTDDEVPYGLLPEADAGGLGLILAPEVTAPVLIPTPSPARESATVDLDLILAADSSARVEMNEERLGLRAAAAIVHDETVARNQRTAELERRIQRRAPFTTNLSWADASAGGRWTRQARFVARFFGKRIPGGMYVIPDLMSSVPSLDAWDDPIDGWYSAAPESTNREIRLRPPPGWTLADVPSDWTQRTSVGEASVRYWEKDGTLEGETRLEIFGAVLDRKGYLELRDLTQATAEAERRPVMLSPPLSPPVTTRPGPAAPK